MKIDIAADKTNTAIVLPVYNSAQFLPDLILELLESFSPQQLIAVNDGSQDNSSEICREYGIILVEFKHNQGKGAALISGMQKAHEMGYIFAVCMDSDGQHAPRHINDFISQQNRDNSGIILGMRSFAVSKMPWQRICSNKLTSFIVSCTVHKRIIDSQCGFRMYYLPLIINKEYSSKRYQLETEILLKIIDKNTVVSNVPIDTIYGSEISYINHFRDIRNFVAIILKRWLRLI